MHQSILYNKHHIHYKDTGEGNTIVLLHGFLESCEIWKEFTEVLSNKFRVISIDLPGHGRSEVVSDIHSMELMADCVYFVLQHLKIEKCVVVGHSMGGYVALDFAERYSHLLKGMVLFHSHALKDSEEAKKQRELTIEKIKIDHNSFINNFIPDLFATINVEKYLSEIEKLIFQASCTPKIGIIAALEGMKIRNSKLNVLATSSYPVLFIIGKEDKRINVIDILSQTLLPSHSEMLLLSNTGHVGYIEAKNVSLSAIQHFTERAF